MTEGRKRSAADPWAGLPEGWEVDSRFDGKETGCGEMLLDLKIHVQGLEPGARMAIRATDLGAPVEIPAWCRVTQHSLVEAAHPFYLVVIREPL